MWIYIYICGLCGFSLCKFANIKFLLPRIHSCSSHIYPREKSNTIKTIFNDKFLSFYYPLHTQPFPYPSSYLTKFNLYILKGSIMHESSRIHAESGEGSHFKRCNVSNLLYILILQLELVTYMSYENNFTINDSLIYIYLWCTSQYS